MFLLFSSQELAQEACDRLFNNIRNWLKDCYPARIHPLGLISVDSEGNLRPGAAITTQWASPQECNEGWYLVKPEQKDLGAVPLEIALEGVGGEEIAEIGFPENS